MMDTCMYLLVGDWNLRQGRSRCKMFVERFRASYSVFRCSIFISRCDGRFDFFLAFGFEVLVSVCLALACCGAAAALRSLQHSLS